MEWRVRTALTGIVQAETREYAEYTSANSFTKAVLYETNTMVTLTRRNTNPRSRKRRKLNIQ